MINDDLNLILKDLEFINKENLKIDKEIQEINDKVSHRISVCENTDTILEQSSKNFRKLTSIINKKDIPFFMLSLILKAGTTMLIKKMREMSDKELAKKTPFHREEHSGRMNYRYYASKEEIITNPVPFDAIQKAHATSWYKEHNLQIPGFSGFNHRATALGHDPVLGLIFGTANIMTSTITRNDFMSWHVDTLGHDRTSSNGANYTVNLDTINEPASTFSIFTHIQERLTNEGKEGWMTLGVALLKEIIHLLSDLPSKQSLPIPFIPVFSPQLANKLSLYGLNTGTIVQGAFAFSVINFIISFLHKLMYSNNNDENDRLLMARTKKIIAYSDLLSTVSDIGYSIFLAYMGDKNAMRKFNLGGYLVTLNDINDCFNIISEIEREFYVNDIINKFNCNG